MNKPLSLANSLKFCEQMQRLLGELLGDFFVRLAVKFYEQIQIASQEKSCLAENGTLTFCRQSSFLGKQWFWKVMLKF